jgi:sugar/nucleoside kinase (ribokinase family)
MVADRGANARLRPDDLPPELVAGAVLVSGYLLLQDGAQEAGVEAIRRSRAGWIAVEAATWPLVEAIGPARFHELASGASVVLANEREAEALTSLGPIDAARELGERYRVVAVKRGAAGAVLVVDGSILEGRADAIDERDPTGAGDAFDGVLLASLARGIDPEESLHRACRAGAEVAASASAWPAAP